MKLVKLLISWGVVAIAAFGAGLQLSKIEGALRFSPDIFKSAGIGFAAASACLAFVFRLLDTAPPKELDEDRQRRWVRLFRARWQMLWARWGILIFSSIVAGSVGSPIEKITGSGAANWVFAAGFSAIVVGVIIAIQSVRETFHIRDEILKTTLSLQERAKKQEMLNRLEGEPKAGTTARA